MRRTNWPAAPICFGQEMATERPNCFEESTGRLRISEALDTRGPDREYEERQYLSLASLFVRRLDHALAFGSLLSDTECTEDEVQNVVRRGFAGKRIERPEGVVEIH